MDVPQNETPPAVSSFLDTLLGLLSSYGWHLVFFLVLFNLIWTHLKPKFQNWQQKRQNRQQEEEYLQSPDKLISMQEALDASRRRLQEQHDRLAKEHADKLKQAEEEKRNEKINKWESVQHGRSFEPQAPHEHESQPSPSGRDKPLGRQDYNPLMGTSSSTSFRPSRRGGGSTGG